MRNFHLLPAAILLAISALGSRNSFAQDPGVDRGAQMAAASNQAMSDASYRSRWSSQDAFYYGYGVPGGCPRAPEPVTPNAAATSQPPSSASDSAPAQTQAPAAKPSAIVLPCGTLLRLEFVSSPSSKTARVGDHLSLRVTQEVKYGDAVVVPIGALADATVTFVYRGGSGGIPGQLAFELNALQARGVTVPLWRVQARSGEPKPPGPAVLIPVAGMLTMFRHGKDAEIKPGTPVAALVAADTTLPLP